MQLKVFDNLTGSRTFCRFGIGSEMTAVSVGSTLNQTGVYLPAGAHPQIASFAYGYLLSSLLSKYAVLAKNKSERSSISDITGAFGFDCLIQRFLISHYFCKTVVYVASLELSEIWSLDRRLKGRSDSCLRHLGAAMLLSR